MDLWIPAISSYFHPLLWQNINWITVLYLKRSFFKVSTYHCDLIFRDITKHLKLSWCIFLQRYMEIWLFFSYSFWLFHKTFNLSFFNHCMYNNMYIIFNISTLFINQYITKKKNKILGLLKYFKSFYPVFHWFFTENIT